MAALPYRLHAADLPRLGLGDATRREPQFADIVVAEAATQRPIVLVQDYHFALLPRMIRERLPEAIIITFWHIPWPNSEVFSICPWRERDSRRAARQLDRRLPHPVPLQQLHRKRRPVSGMRASSAMHSSISYGGDTTLVHAYPISIEWPPPASGPAAGGSAAAVCARYGLSADIKLPSASSASTTPRAFSTASRRSTSCSSNTPNGSAGSASCRSPRPAGHAARLPAAASGVLAFVDDLNERYGSDGYQPMIMIGEHHGQDDLYDALPRR